MSFVSRACLLPLPLLLFWERGLSAGARTPALARMLAVGLSGLGLPASPVQGQPLCLAQPSDPQCQVFAESLNGTNFARAPGAKDH